MGKSLSPRFAVYPSVKMYGFPDDYQKKIKEGKIGVEDLDFSKFGFKKELLFGDYISPTVQQGDYVRLTVPSGKYAGQYVSVHCRNADGYIHEEDMQEKRPLEVNFVDVGQGDGCHVVTPDDKHFLIDAGELSNMYRYLKWRFNLKYAKKGPPAFTCVISHPDSDHYGGFGKIFDNSMSSEEKKALEEAAKLAAEEMPAETDKAEKTTKKSKKATQGSEKENTAQIFEIARIYHNGIVETTDTAYSKPYKKLKRLGTLLIKGENKYIADLCDTDDQYQDRIGRVASGPYIKVLKKSNAAKMSLREGSAPIYDNPKYGMKMEVMAPLATIVDGQPAFPVLGGSDLGKTKNGHSVVIKLTIGHLRILLGGDLNTEAEYNLIHHYSDIDIAAVKEELKAMAPDDPGRPAKEAEREKAIVKARESLGADIAKSCHHGSADFSSDFLRVINPIATVISSGDNEPHSHPRPDALGTIGKFSRGERSLIFSTELARSSKEYVEMILSTSKKETSEEKETTDKKKAAKKKTMSAEKRNERAVTVYGMINLRTDGERVIIAQKLERVDGDRSWDIHKIEWNESKGDFVYITDKE